MSFLTLDTPCFTIVDGAVTEFPLRAFAHLAGHTGIGYKAMILHGLSDPSKPWRVGALYSEGSFLQVIGWQKEEEAAQTAVEHLQALSILANPKHRLFLKVEDAIAALQDMKQAQAPTEPAKSEADPLLTICLAGVRGYDCPIPPEARDNSNPEWQAWVAGVSTSTALQKIRDENTAERIELKHLLATAHRALQQAIQLRRAAGYGEDVALDLREARDSLYEIGGGIGAITEAPTVKRIAKNPAAPQAPGGPADEF